MDIDSKKIAKNTLYLYLRFLLILVVNLYSSRVVLEELGVTDFGIYNVVYSVIGFISFLSGSLSGSTSRFLTYELGAANENKLKRTFNTTWVAHVILALLIIFIAETLGLWYVLNILVLPSDLFVEALIIYQISIITTVLSILQIPFTAAIIAHESMSAYAWIGIFEAATKLMVAVLLTLSYFTNKLMSYSIMFMLVCTIVCVLYIIYAKVMFKEVSFKFKHDSSILKAILKFSGWGILANLCNVININGIVLLYNLFFSPVVVAAQTIANQVANGLSQLTYNVRAAVNPQIIKLYADNNYEKSQRLTISSTELLFYISMITCLPCIAVTPFLLNIWLKEVPDYTILFTRLMLFQAIIDTFNASYYAPMLAANKVAKNSIIGIVISIVQFLTIFMIFKIGGGPIWARYIGLVVVFIASWIIKPYLLCTEIHYPVKIVINSLFKCFKKLIVISCIVYMLYLIIPQDNTLNNIILFGSTFVVTGIVVLILMSSGQKAYLINLIKSRIGNKSAEK